VIDDSGKLKTDIEMFGYVFNADKEGQYKDPFIIRSTSKKDFMVLEYGTGRENTTDKVNPPQKEVKVGECFTRWQNHCTGNRKLRGFLCILRSADPGLGILRTSAV
jgi:hypothetical protein